MALIKIKQIDNGLANTGGIVVFNGTNNVWTNNDSGSIRVPSGNTAQRPSPVNGMVRYNTDSNCLETYVNGKWECITTTFGRHYHYAEDLTVSTTTSEEVYVQKLRLTTSSVPPGTYRVGWSFQWNGTSIADDFLGRIQVDDAVTLAEYRMEPTDAFGDFSGTGSDQQYEVSGFGNVTFLSQSSHNVDLDWATSDDFDEVSIWNARLEFWRVG